MVMTHLYRFWELLFIDMQSHGDIEFLVGNNTYTVKSKLYFCWIFFTAVIAFPGKNNNCRNVGWTEILIFNNDVM